jgi:hypothetical protein
MRCSISISIPPALALTWPQCGQAAALKSWTRRCCAPVCGLRKITTCRAVARSIHSSCFCHAIDYIAVVLDISVAVEPLHRKESAKTFPLVVPVDSVPVVLKLVEKVSVNDVVPLVVITIVPASPAVQFVALSVSVCAGVKVKTVPLLKSTETVELAVNAELPMPPLGAGKMPVAWNERFTSEVEASINTEASVITANTVLFKQAASVPQTIQLRSCRRRR